MNKEEKTAEQLKEERDSAVANNPTVKWMIRYIAFPTILLLWFGAFEMFEAFEAFET